MSRPNVTRRYFFQECALGVGKIALASLVADGAMGRLAAAGSGQMSGLPHHPPKAKAVIHLFMAGAPSQLELFDYKPELAKLEGKPLPPSIINGQRYAFIRPDAAVLGPRYKFARHGQSGAELSEMIPHIASIADDIAIVKSCRTTQFNHAPAQIYMNTGFSQPGRPSMGSWITYGLGSEAKDLPSFVVMSTGAGISGGAACWSSGFLPSSYAGTRFRNTGDAILNTATPAGIDPATQKDTIGLINAMNDRRLRLDGDSEIATRIANYEMAYRLQTSAPDLMDLSSETKETLELYGCDPKVPSFARACLLARRMVERGVRFINIYNEGWDAHSDVAGNVRNNCAKTDKASAALVKDLKRRGLLDSTLVVWGGEFGRTPFREGRTSKGDVLGRDHYPDCFSVMMAGGGVKGGFQFGETDEMGFGGVKDKVHVHDLQATIMHLLGFDHERLTYRFQGRDYRLTDVHGHVVRDIIA
jgi:hypothetical protein